MTHRITVGSRRVIVRNLPGFTWIQVGVSRQWKWNDHYWAVRGFARTHKFGYLWICTMRSDALERIQKDGMPE